MTEALQTIEHLIQQLQNEVAAQGARAGGIHHIEHAWPFFQIKRDQWERLTPEQKAIVESVASGFLIQHAAGPVPATPKKDRPRARPSAQILPFVQKMRLINPSMPYN